MGIFKKTKEVEPLRLVVDTSRDGYTFGVYTDKKADSFFLAIVKDSVKHKETFDQIVLSQESLKKLSNWLCYAEANESVNPLCVHCVSHCEVMVFDKMDNMVYAQLYQVASFHRQRRGKTNDEFLMTEKDAGVVGRTLRVFLNTGHC